MSSEQPQKGVVVIGAGPYGLSATACLQDAGVDPYVIGRSMSFWKEAMPKGMLLRSELEASNIAAPQKHLSLAAYQRTVGIDIPEPIPSTDFIAYGDWFQRQVAPTLDTRHVLKVSANGNGFNVAMEGGETIHTKKVVLALGIGSFAQRPAVFERVPSELAPHSSLLLDPAQLKGRRVAVIGKGQSALESAALLHESGADVTVITRAASLLYLKYPWRRKILRFFTPGPLTPFSHWLFPPTDLGSIATARVIAHPRHFRKQTPSRQEWLARSVTRPIGAYWLPRRLNGVTVKYNRNVTSAERVGNQLRLTLDDGASELFDQAVLGTGYKVDISQWEILESSLRQAIRTVNGYPDLTLGCETSVQGLHMVGVVAEKTLGPTLRFVTGTSNAGPRVAAAISGRPLPQ
jgi:thioredoxin reductase